MEQNQGWIVDNLILERFIHLSSCACLKEWIDQDCCIVDASYWSVPGQKVENSKKIGLR